MHHRLKVVRIGAADVGGDDDARPLPRGRHLRQAAGGADAVSGSSKRRRKYRRMERWRDDTPLRKDPPAAPPAAKLNAVSFLTASPVRRADSWRRFTRPRRSAIGTGGRACYDPGASERCCAVLNRRAFFSTTAAALAIAFATAPASTRRLAGRPEVRADRRARHAEDGRARRPRRRLRHRQERPGHRARVRRDQPGQLAAGHARHRLPARLHLQDGDDDGHDAAGRAGEGRSRTRR